MSRTTTIKSLWGTTALLMLASTSFQPVLAQETNATCLPQFAWMYNHLGQSPCLVTAYLGSVCNGGQYTVPALNPGSHYVGPTAAQVNTCQCSSVIYSTISACGICQNGSSVVSWSGWDLNCGSVSVGLWPNAIPPATAIPSWAYTDPTAADTFDPVKAQQIAAANQPDSTATQRQSTIGGPSGTSGSNPTSSSGPTSGSKKSSNAGAIAGGVVGGIVGLAVVALIVFWFLRKRRADETPASAEFTKRYSIDGVAPGGGYGTPGGPHMAQPWQQPPPSATPVLYDPNNPLTFPTSPAPGSTSTYVTPGYPGYGHPQTSPGPVQPPSGHYAGIAEI